MLFAKTFANSWRMIGIVIIIIIIALISILSIIKISWWMAGKQETSPIAIKAAPAPALRDIQKVSITPAAPVKVYAPKAKETLRLPPSIQADTSQHVSAAAHISASYNPQTVTTVFDDKTGESTDYVTQEPLPWMAVDLHGEVGLAYGLKNGMQTVRLSASQSLIDIKSVRIGITATADQPISGPVGADYFIGTGAWYRW